MQWARKPDPEIAYYETKVKKPSQALQVGDVILVKLKEKVKETDLWALALEQEPITQAALLCIEAETGFVKAMVGGMDFRESQFNRAFQCVLEAVDDCRCPKDHRHMPVMPTGMHPTRMG